MVVHSCMMRSVVYWIVYSSLCHRRRLPALHCAGVWGAKMFPKNWRARASCSLQTLQVCVPTEHTSSQYCSIVTVVFCKANVLQTHKLQVIVAGIDYSQVDKFFANELPSVWPLMTNIVHTRGLCLSLLLKYSRTAQFV